MRSDVDRLLQERGLSAALVLRGETPNPTFRYLAGPAAAHITAGILVWQPGKRPHLVHAAMERDSAAATGFELSEYGAHGYRKILEEEGTRERANARLLTKVLGELGVKGPILIHGYGEVGRNYHVLNRLREWAPGIEIAEDEDLGLFDRARISKEPDEVDAVRAVAGVCGKAYARIREVIGSGRLEGKRLKDAEGWVTIGRLRREVRKVFFDADLEQPHGNIIAMGRDAGVPHNVGNDAEVIEEGRPIVIDLYPVQAGAGFRRNAHALRRARRRLRSLRARARAVDRTVDCWRPKPRTHVPERSASLRAARTKTIRRTSTPRGLHPRPGDGIGIEIYERPHLGGPSKHRDRIAPGSLFTVEPGLYYPSRHLGVRIEDVVFARPDGSFQNMTEIPYELEVAPAAN
jgi:Xaa-Pro aminopeptidase